MVTYRRRHFLTDDDCRVWLREAVLKTRQRYPLTMDAWVLLPNHLHCIWTLPENDNSFSVRWNGIKKRFSTLAKQRLHKPEWVNSSRRQHREGVIWQRHFWGHHIRDDNDYEKHVDYIHYNPVKQGSVKRENDWPYSTFHRYVNEGSYPINWAGVANENTFSFGE